MFWPLELFWPASPESWGSRPWVLTLFIVKSQGTRVAWAGPLDQSCQGACQQVIGGRDVQPVDRLILTEFTHRSWTGFPRPGLALPKSGQGKSTQVGRRRRQKEEVTSNLSPQTISTYWTNNLNEDVIFYNAQPRDKSKNIILLFLFYFFIEL